MGSKMGESNHAPLQSASGGGGLVFSGLGRPSAKLKRGTFRKIKTGERKNLSYTANSLVGERQSNQRRALGMFGVVDFSWNYRRRKKLGKGEWGRETRREREEIKERDVLRESICGAE